MPRYQLPPGPGRPPKPPGECKVPIAAKIAPGIRARWQAIADRFFAGSKVAALEIGLSRGWDAIEAERTEEDDSG